MVSGIVYTHHPGNLDVDHRIVHQAIVTACRPLAESFVKAIYAFEPVSSTEWQTTGEVFRFQRWVDIEPFVDRKPPVHEACESEMRPFPHARSVDAVEALARVRVPLEHLPAVLGRRAACRITRGTPIDRPLLR